MQQVLQMIIFFICFFLFSALIAVKIIGNLDNTAEYNEVWQVEDEPEDVCGCHGGDVDDEVE